MVPASSARVSRVPAYSGSRCRALPFAYGALTLFGRPSQFLSAGLRAGVCGPKPRNARIPVCPLPLSLAATQEIDFSFSSSPYLDVSVQAVPLRALCVRARMAGVLPAGFPHSDTRGSRIICISPRLFAACRVFHRPLVPRHPPCALLCLIICRHSVGGFFAGFSQSGLTAFLISLFPDLFHLFGSLCAFLGLTMSSDI